MLVSLTLRLRPRPRSALEQSTTCALSRFPQWFGSAPLRLHFSRDPFTWTIRRLCFFSRLVSSRRGFFLCLHHPTFAPCCRSTNLLPPLQRTALLVSPGVSRVPRLPVAGQPNLRCHIAGSLDPGPRFFIPPPPPALPRPATLGHTCHYSPLAMSHLQRHPSRRAVPISGPWGT